jgi:putative transposase
MSRPLRLDHAGAIWHVTSRGNELKEIYRDDGDRQRWLDVLGRVAGRYNWRVYGYVQMGNHYHLLIETVEASLSRGMRQLNGVYAQAFNRRHKRVGHLFQGRFHGELVQRETHLLEVLRYVVLNPVRAGMVGQAGDWAWSSYRATAGLGGSPAWLDTLWAIEQFGGSRKRYAAFVAEGRGAYNPRAVRGRGIAIGDERFRREVAETAVALRVDSEIPAAQRCPAPLRVDHLLPRLLGHFRLATDALGARHRHCDERGLVAWGLSRFGQASGRVIGPLLGVGRSQASRLTRRGGEAWSALGLTGPPN